LCWLANKAARRKRSDDPNKATNKHRFPVIAGRSGKIAFGAQNKEERELIAFLLR